MFSGHDHVYSRAEASGVRYFVSGGGGAPLYPRKANSARLDVAATQYFERVNHYLRVHVYGDLIEVSAIRADGTLIETMSWGTPPRPGELVARAGAGEPGATAASAAPLTAAGAAPARIGSAGEAQGNGGLGPMGLLGIAATVASAAAILWLLRR